MFEIKNSEKETLNPNSESSPYKFGQRRFGPTHLPSINIETNSNPFLTIAGITGPKNVLSTDQIDASSKVDES